MLSIRDIIWKSTALLIGCGAVLYLDSLEHWPLNLTKVLLLVMALIKSLFFVWQGFRKIKESAHQEAAYYQYLLFIGVNIVLMIVSFGFDFFALGMADKACFLSVTPPQSAAYWLFDCLYMSLLNMTNFGYGSVQPIGITAKCLTALEIILSFVAIIFVLSDFMSLRESLAQKGPDATNSD